MLHIFEHFDDQVTNSCEIVSWFIFFLHSKVIPAAYSSSNEAELAKTTKAKMTLKDISPFMSLMKFRTLFW